MKKAMIVLSLSVSLLWSPACKGTSDDSDDLLLFLLLFLVIDNPPPVQTYVDRATTALQQWDIGLQTGIFGSGRSTNTNFALNPPNWITVAGDNCVAKGVPGDFAGANCPLTGGVIGVCFTRFYNWGEIVDTTQIMLNTYQATAPEADAQSVFTHETGHCLGLKHPCDFGASGGQPECSGNELTYRPYIMFPDTSGNDLPSSDELTSIASAYDPVVQAPTFMAGTFFGEVGGVGSFVYIRHWTFPTFVTGASIGSRYSENSVTDETPPGPALKGEVTTVIHKLYADGREEIEYRDSHGRPKYQSYFTNLPPR